MASRNAGRALDVVAIATILKIAVTLLASVWLTIPALPVLPYGLPLLSIFGTLALGFTTVWMQRSARHQAVTQRPFAVGHGRLILGGVAAAGAVLVVLAITVSVTGPHP